MYAKTQNLRREKSCINFEDFCRQEVLPGMRARHQGCSIDTEVLARAPKVPELLALVS